MLESLLNLLNRHQRITVAAAVVLFLAGGSLALLRLSINDSSERWLPASSLEAWRRFAEHYTYGDTIALAAEFLRPVRDGDVELLKAIHGDLTRIEGIAHVIDVSLVAEQIEGVSLTRFLRTPGAGEEDPFAMYRGVLFDDPRRREAAPSGGSGPESPPGRTVLTFIELSTETAPGLDARSRQEEIDRRRRRVVGEIYQVLEDHARDDVRYHVAGGVVIQYELEKIARKAVVTILPVALLVTLSALGMGFRSMGALGIAVLGGLWSVAVVLGGVALAGWTLNVVTVGGPTLMVVIVIATTVHFAHYYSTHDGAAVERTRRSEGPHFIRWVAVPCLGAAAVTGVGFLMLAFNELGPARQLGIELFAGAVLAFFGAFLVWLLIHPFRAAPGRLLSEAGFRRCHRLVVRRPWTTTLVIVAASAALVGATFRVRVDADPFSFFQPEARIARAFEHFSDRDFGLYILDVVLIPLPDTRPDDPQQLEEARREDRRVALAFQRRIERRPEVRNVISAVGLQARQQSLKLDLGREARRFLAFYKTFKNWTEDRAGQDSLRISFMVHDPGTGFSDLVEEVRRSMPEDRFECVYTGTVENVVTLSENLVGGITWALAVATLVMTVLCGLLFRSLRLTLVAVLPNVLPVLVVFGVMGAFGVPLNSGSAMVSTIALGVALCDTVHFVMHYRRRRAAGETTDEALADTFGELGRPIVLTSVVNCLGFAVFLLCDFRPMVHFGLLASIAMIAALLGDLVLLPNLLKLADRGSIRV